jgi:hypothetical protein
MLGGVGFGNNDIGGFVIESGSFQIFTFPTTISYFTAERGDI